MSISKINPPLKVYIDPLWILGLDRNSRLPLAESLLRYAGKFKDDIRIQPYTRDHFVRRIDFSSVVELSNISDCDAILYPGILPEYPYSSQAKMVSKIRNFAISTDKIVFVQASTKDVISPEQLVRRPFERFVYFNPALVRNCTPANFYAAPYFVHDIYKERYSGHFSPIDNGNDLSVGFCGFAPPIKQPWCRTKVFDILRFILSWIDDLGIDSELIARNLGTNMKHAHRLRSIYFLKKDKRIRDDFIIRSTGALQDKSYWRKQYDDFSDEYYRNMESNLYNITSRGTENYSIRFYETFCLGRIPIVIDTDLVLPFASKIDYKRQCVWIPKDKLRKLPDLLLTYHTKHEKKSLSIIQQENRQIWIDFFSPLGFYRQIHSLLKSQF